MSMELEAIMVRRAFDMTAAALGLVVLSPLFLVLALLIRSTSPGPAFFRQERVGLHGRPFRMFKFRSMRQDAEAHGGQLTVGADPRVTRVGSVLRRYKLDELPQLINVVRGEMALVGPRPEVPRYVALYDERQRQVLEMRPGVTDPASIAYRGESELLASSSDPETTYVNSIMPHKLELNLEYLGRRTLLSDIGILLATVAKLARRDADGFALPPTRQQRT